MLAHLVQFMLRIFILMLHVIIMFNMIFFWLKIKCCMLF